MGMRESGGFVGLGNHVVRSGTFIDDMTYVLLFGCDGVLRGDASI